MIMIIQSDRIIAYNKFNSYEVDFINDKAKVTIILEDEIIEFEDVLGVKVYQAGNLIEKIIFVDENDLKKELTKINEGV